MQECIHLDTDSGGHTGWYLMGTPCPVGIMISPIPVVNQSTTQSSPLATRRARDLISGVRPKPTPQPSTESAGFTRALHVSEIPVVQMGVLAMGPGVFEIVTGIGSSERVGLVVSRSSE